MPFGSGRGNDIHAFSFGYRQKRTFGVETIEHFVKHGPITSCDRRVISERLSALACSLCLLLLLGIGPLRTKGSDGWF